MSVPDRADVIAALEIVLDIAAEHPGLPLPEVNTYGADHVHWTLFGATAGRRMAVLEKALQDRGCKLTPGTRSTASREWYELKGAIGSLSVTVDAPAELVAERKVTGTRTVEDVNWVRLPVEDEAAEGTEGR